MSEQLKIFRLAGLEEWRTKSFSLGGPLGHLFTRTFEVIQTVVRDGVENDLSLPYALESLGRERDHAISRDEQRDEPIRQLIYGLSDSLKIMVYSIREEKGGGSGLSEERRIGHGLGGFIKEMGGSRHEGGSAKGANGAEERLQAGAIKDMGGIRNVRLAIKAEIREEEPVASEGNEEGNGVREEEEGDRSLTEARDNRQSVSGASRASVGGVSRASVGGVRQPSVGGDRQEVGGASQPVDGATVDEHLENEATHDEESSSSTSDATIPLFSANLVKREPQDQIDNPDANPAEPIVEEQENSAFDVDDFAGANMSYEAYLLNQLGDALQPTLFSIKRSLSEEPTTSRTLVPFQQRYVSAAAVMAATDPSRPKVVLHGCDICDRFFESEKGMIRHAFTHSAARCPACRKYMAKEKLQKHMKEKHGPSSGRRTVGRPKKKSAYHEEESDVDEEPTARNARAATAAPTTPAADADGRVACDRCDKSFSTLTGLHRHAYVHDSVSCPVCARLVAKHRLKKHMKEIHKEHCRDSAKKRAGSLLH